MQAMESTSELDKVVESNATILNFFKDHDIISFFEYLIEKEWGKKGLRATSAEKNINTNTNTNTSTETKVVKIVGAKTDKTDKM